MISSLFQRLVSLCFGCGLALTAIATPAAAAEKITFIIGPINRSITLDELRTLAETGEARGDLKTIIKVANQTPEGAAEFLTQPFPFDLVRAYGLLTSVPGEAMLEKIGTVLAPRNANSAGAQALSAAILLSLSGDNEFTLLELLEKYPTDARVNVGALQSLGEEFGDVTGLLSTFGGN